MPTIEQKIRDIAKSKVRLSITERVRSSGGFDVHHPLPDGTHDVINVPTKQEALSLLLIKARCFNPIRFEIRPMKSKNRELIWCEACDTYHPLVRSREQHQALKCKAEYRGRKEL